MTVDLDGWHGMQGHNWGREHAFAYTWGQCLFGGVGGDPVCMVEGFSGRIRLAGRATPWISALVVRRGDEVYSFNRIIDLWAQKADVGDLSWTLRMKGPAGEAMLAMEAREPEVVCLGYTDPNGDMAYCLNSKLATTVLRVRPADREGFECRAEHHGALELLRRTADERFGVAA